MKTLVILFVMAIASLNARAVPNFDGSSNSPLGTYRITPIGENLFELRYDKAREIFTIEACPEKQNCCYLIRGKNIELMYVCNELGFGLRKMSTRYQTMDVARYRNSVRTESFRDQSRLCRERKTTREALGLIACFFPNTIQPGAFDLVFQMTPTNETPALSMQR
ncbi:MAG TPA: hypothetical protein PLK12_16365 [Prolixibacteraceae bacterium]|nr:hypothetical protein [Prolixibacteraceae bacterium]